MGHVKPSLAAGGVLTTAAVGSVGATAPLPVGNTCNPSPVGHKRRIYYGVPMGTADGFGLAYEEIDAAGQTVGTPATTVVQYDAAATIVCLPRAKGNVPVKEVWELVNLAGEGRQERANLDRANGPCAHYRERSPSTGFLTNSDAIGSIAGEC